MSRPWGWAVTAAAILAGGAAAVSAAGDAAAPERPAVAVGFAGVYRAGAWTPVVVRATGSGGPRSDDAVHVWAQDPDGQFVRSPPARVATGADGRGRATARVRVGRPAGRLRVESAAAGAGEGGRFVEVDLPAAIPATDRALLVVGDLPAIEPALQRAWQTPVRAVPAAAGGSSAGAEAGPGPAAWVVRTAGVDGDGVGAEPRDYDMFEAIVVCGRAVPRADAALLGAIDEWVRRGGRLIFAAGASAAAIEPRSPAAGWLPGRVVRVTSLRGAAGIEAWVRAGGLPDAGHPLNVPLLAEPRDLPGVVDRIDDAVGAGIPLAVRRAHGLGTLAWLGLDVDEEPLRDWPGTASLLAMLLGGRQAAGEPAAAVGMRGVPDLAGQLRVALERSAPEAPAAPAAPLPFELAIGLGLLYVLCLYPLDWWLVSRGAGRPWLAWFSLPAIVAGFTLLAHGIATRRAAPDAGLRFAAAAVDIDAVTGLVRGSSWSGIHLRRNGLFDVALDVERSLCPEPAERAISWLADAGTGLGGIDAPTAHPALAAADYRYGDSLATLERVPIAAGATRLFEAEWFGTLPGPAISGTLAADAQGTLRGAVAHHLPFPLDDCQLLHRNWLYDVGRLAPGDRHDLASGRGPRSLLAAVTRRRAVVEREQIAAWDPTDTDVARILEVAGLHAAAGGSGYTGLGPGRLGRLDLSAAAGLDRAVLVGTADVPAAGWVYSSGRVAPRGRYRIVIPVARAADPSRPTATPAASPAASPAPAPASPPTP